MAKHEDTPPTRTTRRDPGHVDPRTWARETTRGDWDDDKTPVRPHPRPAPVVLPSLRGPGSVAPLPGPAPRTTPVGTLKPLLARKPTTPGIGALDPFPAEEAPTPTVPTEEQELAREAARLVRNWRACPPDRRKQLSRMALQYRSDAEGLDRG